MIHDVHDMQSLRRTPYEDGFDDPEDPDALERAAVEGCAGLIAVSVGDARRARGALRRSPAADAAVRQLRPGARPVPEARRPRASTGRCGSSTRGACRPTAATTTCASTSRAIGRAGLALDVFPNRDAPAYRELAGPHARDAADGHPRAGRPAARAPGLRRRLGGLQPGLNAAHLDTALPNKAFEYLASGLPVAAGPHARAAAAGGGRGRRLRGRRPRRPAGPAGARAPSTAMRARVRGPPATASPSRGTSASCVALYREVVAAAVAA